MLKICNNGMIDHRVSKKRNKSANYYLSPANNILQIEFIPQPSRRVRLALAKGRERNFEIVKVPLFEREGFRVSSFAQIIFVLLIIAGTILNYNSEIRFRITQKTI